MTTRALVLGGGGPIGVAWEAGLIAGLAESGVDVSNADLFVGTSAGSIVGAFLANDVSPAEIYARQLETSDARETPAAVDMSALIPRFVRLLTSDEPQQNLRAEMGAFALGAKTVDEAAWLAGFERWEGIDLAGWPRRPYACTAIDTSDGAFVVWDNDAGVPLGRAVASSCAVPGVFPPVTINGRRYMDGGISSTTNAHLARGHRQVLVIALTGSGASLPSGNPIADRIRKHFDEELAELREAGGTVDVVTPDEAFVREFGVNLMDFTRRRAAADLGLKQGRGEAARLRDFWA